MKKIEKLLPLVLLRTLPLAIFILLLIWMLTRWFAHMTIQSEVHNNLKTRVTIASNDISKRLEILKGDIRGLSNNDLVINGLIDMSARHNYLPMFFRSLTTSAPEGAQIILTDYRGRHLVSNAVKKTSYEQKELLESITEGREVLKISASGLLFAVPVKYAGLTEGMLVLELNGRLLSELFAFEKLMMLFTLMDTNGKTISRSESALAHQHGPDIHPEESHWIWIKQKIAAFPELMLIGELPEGQAFKQVNKLDNFFILAMIINLIVLILGIFLSSLFSTRPLSMLTKKLEIMRQRDDYNVQLPETGPKEFVELSRSFNAMHTDLLQSVVFKAQLEDIIEKRTQELKNAQHQLVNKAIESGRAQLSAMILHNIGNAMTPLSIQVNKLQKNQLDQIIKYQKRCYQELQANLNQLTEYVSTDTKGKDIFLFLGKLIDTLYEQQEEFKTAFEKILIAVNYITEIISLQQNYAAGERENRQLTNLNVLLNDALKMQTSALKVREIEVQKDFNSDLPLLTIDKNKLMQVIVNLIKNAYESIDELNSDEKMIRLTTFKSEDSIGFKIADTGIGIEPNRLKSILEFGRSGKGSSGFGLYYCKMFVEANKGALTINSDGKNKGASIKIAFDINGE